MEIDLLKISKSYNHQRVLNNITYSFKPNKVYFIVGESGCGKSTLLKIIGKIIDEYSGKVLYDGKNIKDIDENYLKKHIISYIDQSSPLIDYLSIKQNIDLLIDKQTDISSTKKFKNYSGGEKRRISTYVTTLKDSEVILADEISSSLDKNNALLMMNYLREIAKGKVLIVVTHDKFLINEDDIVINLENNVQRKSISKNYFRYKRYKDHKNILKLLKYSFYKFLDKKKYMYNFISSFMVGLTLILLLSSLKTGLIGFLDNQLLKDIRYDYVLVENKNKFNYGYEKEFSSFTEKAVLLMSDLYFDQVKNMIYTYNDKNIIYIEMDEDYSMSKELFDLNQKSYELNLNGYLIYSKNVTNEQGYVLHCPMTFFDDYYHFKGLTITDYFSEFAVLKVNKVYFINNFIDIKSKFLSYKFKNSGVESYFYINNLLEKIKVILLIFIFVSLLVTFFLVHTIMKLEIDNDIDEIQFMYNSGLTKKYIYYFYYFTNIYRGILTFLITIIFYNITIYISNKILSNELGIAYNILSINVRDVILVLSLIIFIVSISIFLLKKRLKLSKKYLYF